MCICVYDEILIWYQILFAFSGCRFSGAGSTGKNKYCLFIFSTSWRPAGHLLSICLSPAWSPQLKTFVSTSFIFSFSISIFGVEWLSLKAKSYMIRTHLKLGQQSINWSNFTGASWLLLGDCAEAANDFIQSEVCVCVCVCVKSFFFLSLVLSDALQGEQQVCFSWPANWHPWGERVLLWSKNTFLWVLEWMSWRWIT